jgi:hypothetical protein
MPQTIPFHEMRSGAVSWWYRLIIEDDGNMYVTYECPNDKLEGDSVTRIISVEEFLQGDHDPDASQKLSAIIARRKTEPSPQEEESPNEVRVGTGI